MKPTFYIAIFMWLITANTVFAEKDSSVNSIKIQSIQKTMREDLTAGNIEQARNSLEQAAGNFHSVEIELGLIQTLMQAGEYRHALSAAAHTQAEHSDTTVPTLFYAWLLAIGGQQKPAQQLLEKAFEHNPNSQLLHDLNTQIKTNHLVASNLNTTDGIQLKPFAEKLPEKFKYLQSGILWNDGVHIITTTHELTNRSKLKVISGLGEIVTAHRDLQFTNENLALLILEKPISISHNIKIAKTPTFPGAPIYLIGYSPFDQSQAKWPQLKADILGTPTDTTNSGYPIHIPDNAAGAGIYNQKGDLLGITVWNASQNNVMIPLDSALAYIESNAKSATASATHKKEKSPNSIATPVVDEIYERALTNSVQIVSE